MPNPANCHYQHPTIIHLNNDMYHQISNLGMIQVVHQYLNIHSYDRLWDRFGKPIPSRFNNSNTHPTTPLKVLIDCLEENKNNEENLVIYFNMTKVLLVNGADAKSSLIYFLQRYPDFNMDENNNNYNILFKAIGLIISLSCQGMIM